MNQICLIGRVRHNFLLKIAISICNLLLTILNCVSKIGHWTDLHETLRAKNGQEMSIEELIKKDPYTVVTHFDRRLETLFNEVLRLPRRGKENKEKR